MLQLQGGKFDIPDRLFDDIIDTFYLSTNDQSDVRELTAELFTLPEMFINLNILDLGVKQDGERVNHVQLPKWAKGNPYYFVV